MSGLSIGYFFAIDLLLFGALALVGISYKLRRKLPVINYEEYHPEFFHEEEKDVDIKPRDPMVLRLKPVYIIIIIAGLLLLVYSLSLSQHVYKNQVKTESNTGGIEFLGNAFPNRDPGERIDIYGKVDNITLFSDLDQGNESLGSIVINRNFNNTVLSNRTMVNTRFRNCNFRNVVFDNVSLSQARFTGCYFDSVFFSGCDLDNISMDAGCILSYVYEGDGQVTGLVRLKVDHLEIIAWNYEGMGLEEGDKVHVKGTIVHGHEGWEMVQRPGFEDIDQYELVRADAIEKTEDREGGFQIDLLSTLMVSFFAGIVLLALGLYLVDGNGLGHAMVGWGMFGTYWLLYLPHFMEIQDSFNAVVTVLAFALFIYIAYQEFISTRLGYDHHSLRWLAGGAFIGAFVYFLFDKIPLLEGGLIKIVADQTAMVMNAFGLEAHAGGMDLAGNPWWYKVNPKQGILVPIYSDWWDGKVHVRIILACTGIQAMAMYAGALAAVGTKNKRALTKSFLASVPVIYIANLARNSALVWATTEEIWGRNTFELAHNWVTKFLALLLLIIITLYIFKILPELFDNIIGLTELHRREEYVGKSGNLKNK